jgi:uncharacterized spore protein YtfJ
MAEANGKSKNNDFNQTVSSMFKGMDSFLTTKTVVGEPTQIGDTIIVPLVDVNFGVGAGAMSSAKGSDNAAGGMGGKLSPSAVLVIQNGRAKMVPVHDSDTLTKVLDMIPEMVDKVSDLINRKCGGAGDASDAEQAAQDVLDSLTEEEF